MALKFSKVRRYKLIAIKAAQYYDRCERNAIRVRDFDLANHYADRAYGERRNADSGE